MALWAGRATAAKEVVKLTSALVSIGADWCVLSTAGSSVIWRATEVGPGAIFCAVLLVGLLVPAIRRAYAVEREAAAHLRERAFADEALRTANVELARSNDALEAFAYAASHDLKQPLCHVAMFLGLLDDEYSDTLDAEARGYIAHALSGARRMSRLIDGMLRLSRSGERRGGKECRSRWPPYP